MSLTILLAGFGSEKVYANAWSLLSVPQQAGQVNDPRSVATDASGNLYIVDGAAGQARIQKRDLQGNWSVIAMYGNDPNQVDNPREVAIDGSGNLFVHEEVEYALPYPNDSLMEFKSRIKVRSPHGDWSVIAEEPQIYGVKYITADIQGNLYVSQSEDLRTYDPASTVLKRDPSGHWSKIFTFNPSNQFPIRPSVSVMTTDSVGTLYAIYSAYSDPKSQILKYTSDGNWTVVENSIDPPSGMAVDPKGFLVIANSFSVQKRNNDGAYASVAVDGMGLGEVYNASSVAVDASGNTYITDGGYSEIPVLGEIVLGKSGFYPDSRVQMRDATGKWTILGIRSKEGGERRVRKNR